MSQRYLRMSPRYLRMSRNGSLHIAALRRVTTVPFRQLLHRRVDDEMMRMGDNERECVGMRENG
jgi:hypothetical protein